MKIKEVEFETLEVGDFFIRSYHDDPDSPTLWRKTEVNGAKPVRLLTRDNPDGVLSWDWPVVAFLNDQMVVKISV